MSCQVSTHNSMFYCRSGSHQLPQAVKQTPSGLLVARQITQISSRPSSSSKLLLVNLSCTPNFKPWWLASSRCVLQGMHGPADSLQLTQLTETAPAHAAEQSSNTIQFSKAVHAMRAAHTCCMAQISTRARTLACSALCCSTSLRPAWLRVQQGHVSIK